MSTPTPGSSSNHSVSYGLIGLLVLFSIMMAWLSVARYAGYNLHSFDLGNMGQAIWSVQEGRPLVFTTEGIAWSRLAFHVELFYLLLTPLYALWPSPTGLLIFQALLYAAGAIPLYRLGKRQLGHEGAALLLTAVYLLYPVGQTAVLFQFHGDTLAMPLLLFALDALDRRAWWAYGLWLALALSCKFYVAIPVAAMGVVIWLQGERRAGLATALGAMVWGAIAFLVIRPFFAPAESVQAAATTGGYLSYYFSQLGEMWATLPVRLANGLIVFAPVVLLAWRAPLWLLPAAAVALPTLISNGPGPTYDYRYHHYALAAPFLLAAAVYGAAAMKQREKPGHGRPAWLGRVWLTFGLTLGLSMLLVDTPLSPLFYLAGPGSGRGMDETGYGRSPRDAFKDQWLAENVPSAAPLMADDRSGSRLFNRLVYYRTTPQFNSRENLLPEVDYVVIDALNDFNQGQSGVMTEYDTIVWVLNEPEWRLLRADDGLLLFGRAGEGLEQTVTQTPLTGSPPVMALFAHETGEAQIALVAAEVLPVGANRFQLQLTWWAQQPDLPAGLTAVSRVEGLPHSRFVHLGTAVLLPTDTWRPDQLIQETVEIALPPDTPPGEYSLLVGWYDMTHLAAADTDAQSRLGQEIEVTRLTLTK